MRVFTLVLALVLLDSLALAGPNAGDVVWMHDTRIMLASDTTAACCSPEGTCTITLQADCPAGSVWHEDPCTPDPCPFPTGTAWVTNSWTYSAVTVLVGQTDYLLDPGETAEIVVTAPTELCIWECIWNGSGWDCQWDCAYTIDAGQQYCVIQEGPQWDLALVTCGTTGACCLAGGVCVVLSEYFCSVQQGSYQGEGTPCQPDPCTPTPTERTTWGQIKAAFR